MQFDLVEPLRNLFKDEVRLMGEELGLPEEIVWRQPFPGPGLAVRIVGTVTPERLEILRRADAIVTEEIKRAGLYRELWQSFAVLPAVRTVGVMGDERTYAYPIVIRAVTSDDAMTADWARLPYDVLERMSTRHHQRGAGREPGGLRHHVEAARAPSSGSSPQSISRPQGDARPSPGRGKIGGDGGHRDLLEGLNPVQREAVDPPRRAAARRRRRRARARPGCSPIASPT